MTKRREQRQPIGLVHPGMRALVHLTNEQFSTWIDNLRAVTSGDFEVGHGLNYWFLLSALAVSDNFEMKKKELHERIPQLKSEAGRRYVGDCVALGLIEVVSTKGTRLARLTSAGARAVEATLNRWVEKFGGLHEAHFRQPRQP